ncbi:MAG TPA: lipoyl synthase, partial [Gammaproteobacteria bacterium]|nr:lipoyl synthase [Gammaproteobacteria bacterium]
MNKLENIPIQVIHSGSKYRTEQGFNAIKDGIKSQQHPVEKPKQPKPPWLKIKLQTTSSRYKSVKQIVNQHKLSTVCEEAKCPNISECWDAGTATIMLMGAVCTRACRFCSVDTGNPKGWLDTNEPDNAADSVRLMQLKYVVLTSVNRDDLVDGGAEHYANTVRKIKTVNPDTAVEVLTPDFKGDQHAIETVLNSGIAVFAQNIETVKRLTHPVRDPRAGYQQTLNVLAYAKKLRPDILTKTSIILGLGETDDEIFETMDDLKKAHVDILTLGQYLRPTLNHLPVERFVTPDEFEHYRKIGLAKGFLEVVSGP